ITTASPPFLGIFGVGATVLTFVYMNTSLGGDVVLSGYAYQDMDGLNGYIPGEAENSDRPVNNAIIRSPGAENFVSYTKSNGYYATYGFTANTVCRSFSITAVHPQTMYRETQDIVACDKYEKNDVNFKLADKDTVIPDSTTPDITINMEVAAGQTGRFIAGTVPVGTEILVPVTVIDQEMGTASITLKIVDADGTVRAPVSAPLMPGDRTLHRKAKDGNPPVYSYSYTSDFNAPIAGSVSHHFKPDKAGVYTFEVSATDTAGNMSNRVIEVRAIESGSSLEGKDGAPRVDAIIPGNGAYEVLVNNPVEVFFDEPVENVTDLTFRLVDFKTGLDVPAFVYTMVEEDRMKAVLQAKNNLVYGRKYEVILSTAIRDSDAASNTTAGGVKLQLAVNIDGASEYKTWFTTMAPQVYDLGDGKFSGGSVGGVDLYSHPNGHTYAYVTANENGWYVVNVTDPEQPAVVHHHRANNGFSFRGVTVDNGIMAMTDTVNIYGGGQYGYVRFYDLRDNPELPTHIGQERLAEAWSGIPWRVAINGNLAYVATVMVGVQVVDIEMARNFSSTDYGASIVGNLDTPGMGYGNPADLAIIKGDKMLVATTTGRLIVADINLLIPQVLSVTGSRTETYSAFRVDAATEFSFYDSRVGADQGKSIIDIAVTSSFQGKINTVDISDPYNPQVLGTAVNYDGTDLDILAKDIMISKTSGLVFVAAGDAVYIIDIKDPINPKLVFKTSQDGGNANDLSSIILATGIVERDGTVYVADRQAGLKILNTELKLLKHLCDDLDFNNVSKTFCTDYYPALGEKAVILSAYDENKAPLNDPDRVKLMGPLPQGVHVRPDGRATVCTSAEISGGNCRVTLVDGKAKFYVKTNEEFNHYQNSAYPYQYHFLNLTFKLDRLTAGSVLEDAPATTGVELRIRDNSNVRLSEVLGGTAVYTYDLDTQGGYLDGVEEQNRRFYYVQELINQVVPRKRTVAGYQLTDEDGIYGQNTANAIGTFKENFNVSANTATYKTDIFQKLMKDYVVSGSQDDWLNRVVDKETLVGKVERTERTSTVAQDQLINGVTLNVINDTGLYELYVNVVKRFVDGIIEEGKYFAGINGEMGVNAPTNNWISRDGKGPGQRDSDIGMSYCYGCKNTIAEFNDQVSGVAPGIAACTAPSSVRQSITYYVKDSNNNFVSKTGSIAVSTNTNASYSGNLNAACNAFDGNKKYTGLRKFERDAYFNSPFYLTQSETTKKEFPQLNPTKWRGIDCSGFVTRTMQKSLSDLNNSGNTIVNLSKVSNGSRLLAFDSSYAPDNWGSQTFFTKSDMTYYQKGYKKDLVRKVKKGDLVRYGGHISIVYSDRTSCPKNEMCSYEIIHASGSDEVCYKVGRDEECNFNRKVIVNEIKKGLKNNYLKKPKGFGRIKLWD
ncbi:MAG: Ig-like domain-containing protein, partial [Deltaproteobacteria bacterium]|nr:Ig-like domain-containing protein [Deltaproteobacteria bacterium]